MLRVALCSVLTLLLSACGSAPDPSKTVVHGVNFVGVSVSDLERSAELYRGAVDLQPVYSEQAAAEGSTGIEPILKLAGAGEALVGSRLLKSTNAQLRLMQFDSPSGDTRSRAAVPVNGPGIAHVCYQVNKETEAYDKFLAAGASPIGATEMVQLSARNPVFYAYAHDPDGIMFEIEHVDVEALELETPPVNDYRIRHVSLATPDIDRSVAFYSKLLNDPDPRRSGRFFKLSGEKLDMISGLPETEIEMAWFQIRNLELEIVQYHSHPTELPAKPRPVSALGYNMIVFDVNNLDNARAALLEAGGVVVSEPEPMDGGEILFGRDPDGNLLGFQRVDETAVVSSQNFKNNGL